VTQSRLLDVLRAAATCDPQWDRLLEPYHPYQTPPTSLHLAVLIEPYLTYILEGRKTVESRFNVHPRPPYRRVHTEDLLLLKQASGPIVGVCRAGAVWNYQLDPDSWGEIKRHFAAALCAQDSFWDERARAAYATLIRIENVQPMPALAIPKRDRRGWVIVADRAATPRML
jgi:hypothetical protein